MSDYLLSAMLEFGLPVLFLVLLFGSLAVPFPTNILIIAAGSFVRQGDMGLIPLLAVLFSGALIGDNLGFALGRWGGRPMVRKITDRFGGAAKFDRAHDMTQRWGSHSIFLTRWLISSLGPFVNVTCGVTDYAWRKFVFWEILGQAIWISLYVSLGYFFSDRVQQVGDIIVNLSGAILGAALALVLGWQLYRSLKNTDSDGPTGPA